MHCLLVRVKHRLTLLRIPLNDIARSIPTTKKEKRKKEDNKRMNNKYKDDEMINDYDGCANVNNRVNDE